MSKSRRLAEDRVSVDQIIRFVLEVMVNIVGKGENAGIQHFLIFPP